MSHEIIQIQPESPLEVLGLFYTHKEGIERFVQMVTTEVKEGRANALKVKAYAKTLETIAEDLDKATKEEQKTEAAKYGDKPFMFAGAEMHLTATKTQYFYDGCNDEEWNEAKLLEDRHKGEREAREKFLKALSKPTPIIDRNGESRIINPPIKKQWDGVKTTIKPEQK